MLDKTELVGIVESAFAPLKCVAELQNYNHAFGFAVYLPDGSRIKHEEKNVTVLQNESALSFVVLSVRTRIETKGIALDKWSFPKKQGG
jgi:hypothetical protein